MADAGGEDRFRALFHQSRDPLFLLDQEARLVDMNRAAEELTGFTLAALRSVPIETTACVDGRPLTRAALLTRLAMVEPGRLGHMEADHLRPDGVRVPLEIAMRRFASGGQVLHVLSAQDISARRASEEAADRRAARDELMLSLAKRFVRQPLDTAAAHAFERVGQFLGVGSVVMQEPGGTGDDLSTRLVWQADPERCVCPRMIADLPKARLGLAVGRWWRWSSGHDGEGEGDGAGGGVQADGVSRRVTAKQFLAAPVVVEDEAVAQIVLADCSQSQRSWSDEDTRLLAFLCELYAIALSHLRERSARAASERRLEAFTSNLPGVIWRRVRRPDGCLVYTFMSGNLWQFIGVTLEEVLRDPDLALNTIHPEDKPGFLQSVDEAAAAQADWSHEFRLVSRTGEQKWVHASGVFQRLSDGCVAWDGFTLDITDRKRSEQALRESETRFRTAFNRAAEGMALIGRNGRWQRVNQSLATLLRTSADVVTGTPVIRWVDRAHRQDVRDLMRPAGGVPSTLLETQVQARRADGSSVWVHGKVAPVLDDGGAVLYWVAHIQDVSAQRATQDLLVAARDQAEATARAKSDFLAMMSHEIRTPLTGIIGLAELLQRDSLAPAPRRRAGRIESAGRLLLGMLDDILMLSKGESGRMAAIHTVFSPASVVSEVRGLLSANAESKGLRLSMDLAPGLPARASGPAPFVRQVLFNLAGNAVKFTHRGRVCLRATWVDGAAATGPDGAVTRPHLLLEVEDTGIGIDPRDRVRLFDPFSQAVRDRAGQSRGGVGLGLAICRRMVDAMDGSFGMDSAPGQGSRFWFRVPLEPVPDQGEAAGGADPRDVPGRPGGLTVVVVDDDDINREVMAGLLAALDCKAIGFPDGRALLAAAADGGLRPPDAVLMDLHMPGPGGAETTRRLRDMGGVWETVPVLGVTAGDTGASRLGKGAGAAGGVMGMAACLVKPITLTALGAALCRHVARRAESAASPTDPPACSDPLPHDDDDGPDAASDPRVLDATVWRRRVTLLGRDRLAARIADLDAVARDLGVWAGGEGERDPHAMAVLAHRIKGAAVTLGATVLAAWAGRLERAILASHPVAPDQSDAGAPGVTAATPVVAEAAGFLSAWAAAHRAFLSGLAAAGLEGAEG
nr:PAS domain S-box protein [Roseospira navarrensis]